MKFNEKLRELRLKNNMTQIEIANKIGVAKSTYSLYESGKREPDVEKIKKIGVALGTTPDELLGLDISLDNKNNKDLNSHEYNIIKKYRQLDSYGKKIVDIILNEEYLRVTEKNTNTNNDVINIKTKAIPYFILPASAGTGTFLDNNDYEMIDVELNNITAQATFCVRVSGDSMEPKFSDGDIVLVKQQPEIDIDDIGIFIVNGEGFIKKCGEDKLISLNPSYHDMIIHEYDEVYTKGIVIGKL